MHPIRYAARSLGQARTLSAVAILSVGLGTALCVLVVMVLGQSVLLTPTLPHADRIISIMARGSEDCRDCPDGLPLNVATRWGAHPLSSIASFGLHREADLVLDNRTTTTRIHAAAIQGDFFPSLGAHSSAGRLPGSAELATGDPAIAVVSQHLVSRLGFTSSAVAIGQHLLLSGRSVTIVGVLAAGHEIPTDAEIWVTDRLFAAPGGGEARIYTALARLRPTATLPDAARELDDLGLEPAVPGHIAATVGATLLADNLRRTNGPALPLLIAAALATLVLATANLQSLLIVRAIDNSGAAAIRLALGATGRDLVRLLAIESVLLCALGAIPAIGTVLIGRAVLAPYLASEWLRPVTLGFDSLSISALFLLPCLMALAGLIAPAWHVSTFNLRTALQEESSGLSSSRRQVRLRMTFVVAQVAVALVLVVAAGLLIRAYASLGRIDVGYDPDKVAVAEFDLSGTPYDDWIQAGDMSVRALTDLSTRIPGPGAYWVGNSPSLAVGPHDSWTTLQGRASPIGMNRLLTEYHVSSDFFTLFGLRAIRGRLFDHDDRLGSAPVVVVNEIAAKSWWPDEDPIGQRIKLGPEASAMPWLTVVGVVPNTERFDEAGLWWSSIRPGRRYAMAFLPFGQARADRFGVPLPLRNVSIGAPIAKSAPSMIAELRNALQRTGGQLPPIDVRTLSDWQRGSANFPQLLIAQRALGGLAGLALLLAAIGLFGVISENTRMRTAEIGIRRALGARSGHITWLAARPALASLGYGLALGSAIAMVFSRTLLYGFFGITSQNRFGLLLSVSPRDGTALTLSVLVLLGTVALALIGPVRRALTIEPMRALRHLR